MASVPHAAAPVQPASPQESTQPQSHFGPLVIVTLLFFIWGVLTSLNDVLIPHLKAVYTLTYVQAMLVQFCFFGAYAVVALPAGMLIRRIGYQAGAIAGLVVAAIGCFLFYPAAVSSYALFLFAFFVLAAGITVLQVAANPYVTVLGDPRTASSRLSLTQAFNSLGTAVAPAVGGALILSAAPAPETLAAADGATREALRAAEAALVQQPYLWLGGALLLAGVLFGMARLPRLAQPAAAQGGTLAVLRHRHLLLGALGIFLYVGAEVSIGSFLINFLGEPGVAALTAADAAHYVSYYWGGAMVGRFIGFAVMRHVSPGRTLAFNACCCVALLLCAVFGGGALAMWAVIGVGLFNSIMFPTIFSMALHRLGAETGAGSGVLCMAIVGGAVVPFAQGAVADGAGLHWSFLVPLLCYAYIVAYGARYAGMYQGEGR